MDYQKIAVNNNAAAAAANNTNKKVIFQNFPLFTSAA